MWIKAVVVALFALNFKVSHQYKVPQPEIVAYKPKGFSVSIPHMPGIEVFAFHGNINNELPHLSAGEFSIDIRKHERGKWTFQNHNRKLRAGDVIYYWLFVIKDGLGYRLDGGRFEVTEEADAPINWPEPEEPSATEKYQPCLEGVLNLTQTIIQQQNQINSLQLANEQLKTYIQQQPDGRTLTMSGRVPLDDSASSFVSFFLNEKLNLNTVIVSAKRNTDGSITFVVPSVDEKLEILQIAKNKLKSSKIIIT